MFPSKHGELILYVVLYVVNPRRVWIQESKDVQVQVKTEFKEVSFQAQELKEFWVQVKTKSKDVWV